ncbi:MAG: glycosyltransferase [Kiritimatiellia bacterium]
MKSLVLVVPCHNESLRLRQEAFLDALGRWPWLSFCFVDDGSTDATAEILAHLANRSPAIHALYLPENRGKAEAVRAGITYLCANSTAELFGFWDADLATPLGELPRFVHAFDESASRQAVIGVRWPHLGADIARSSFRRLTGTIMKALLHFALHASVYDTQCGAKIFTHSLAREIFRAPFRTKWLFDVELLRRIGRTRLRHATRELPLDAWHDVPGSNLGVLNAFSLLREYFALF